MTPLLKTSPMGGLVSFQIHGDQPPAEHVKQLGAKGL